MADVLPPALQLSANLSSLFLDAPSLTDRYKAARESGFPGVEVVNPYECAIAELVKVKEEQRLEQALVHAFIGETQGIAAVQHRLEEFRQCLELSIQYCTALKCKNLLVAAGVYPENEEISDEHKSACHAVFVSNLRYASQRLDMEGITLLIEPLPELPNYFLTSVGQALGIIEEVSCPNVKLLLNLTAYQLEGNVAATLNQHLDSIGYIRLGQFSEDSEARKQEEANFVCTFSLLLRLGYTGWIGCDSTVKEDTSGSAITRFGWLERYLQVPAI